MELDFLKALGWLLLIGIVLIFKFHPELPTEIVEMWREWRDSRNP